MNVVFCAAKERCIHHRSGCWAVCWLFSNDREKLAIPIVVFFLLFYLFLLLFLFARLPSKHMCNLFTCCTMFRKRNTISSIQCSIKATKKETSNNITCFQTHQTNCFIWRAKLEKKRCAKIYRANNNVGRCLCICFIKKIVFQSQINELSLGWINLTINSAKDVSLYRHWWFINSHIFSFFLLLFTFNVLSIDFGWQMYAKYLSFHRFLYTAQKKNPFTIFEPQKSWNNKNCFFSSFFSTSRTSDKMLFYRSIKMEREKKIKQMKTSICWNITLTFKVLYHRFYFLAFNWLLFTLVCLKFLCVIQNERAKKKKHSL